MARRWIKGVAAAVLAGLVGLTALNGADGAGGLDPTFADRVLAAQNSERAAVGVPPLVWSDALAHDAADWAAHLVHVGSLVHSPDDPNDPDPQGENLWAGTRGYYKAEDMIALWTAEKRLFRPGVFPAVSRTGSFEDVGHYTQMVWRSTRKVGCAMARGPTDDFMVCRYAEGGNVYDERVY